MVPRLLRQDRSKFAFIFPILLIWLFGLSISAIQPNHNKIFDKQNPIHRRRSQDIMYGEMDVPSTSSPMKPSRFPNLTYDNPSQLEPFLSQCNQYGCQTQFINDDLYVLIEVSKAMGYDNFYQIFNNLRNSLSARILLLEKADPDQKNPFMRMSLMIYHGNGTILLCRTFEQLSNKELENLNVTLEESDFDYPEPVDLTSPLSTILDDINNRRNIEDIRPRTLFIFATSLSYHTNSQIITNNISPGKAKIHVFEPMSADVAISPNLCNLVPHPAYCHILQGADENYNGATFFEAICSADCECDSGWYCSRDAQSGNIVGGSYWLVLMPTSYKYTKCENSTLATPIYLKDMTYLLATLDDPITIGEDNGLGEYGILLGFRYNSTVEKYMTQNGAVLSGIPPEVNRDTIDPKNGDCLVMKWLSKPLGTIQWVSIDCRQSGYYFCQKAPASGFNP